MRPSSVFAVIWLVWIVSWIAASRWSAPTAQQVSGRDVWIYRLAIAIGLVLLNHRTALALGSPRLWHVGLSGAYGLAGLAFLGIAFTWWARIHLGSLWSGSIQRKAGHRIVDTGPYGIVRHPIYTGLLTAMLATAIASATAPAIAAVAIGAFGFWLKARLEERFLSAEMGQDTYDAYSRKVPMLVPFWP